MLSVSIMNNEHLRGERINIREEQDVLQWSRKLNCEPNDVIHAVAKIGTCAKMVDDFLFLNRRKKSLHGQ